ncbi:MAG: tRNA (N6-isopentenyl adenosine(37)-C2)-methylthiotransferase MiaB [Candidatus Omnitrophota bacterium]|nr:MAG: tRNA (N6-isopentenyl adenosine(37)-C2)-methylthiotransferase MiaB [Candidatus Omnitrophota bacterium]
MPGLLKPMLTHEKKDVTKNTQTKGATCVSRRKNPMLPHGEWLSRTTIPHTELCGYVPPKCSRVYIKTFGCQMNVRDSEIILGMLQGKGYACVEDPDKADIVLFNTCSVRRHAEQRVWSALGKFREFTVHSSEFIDKKDNSEKKIIGVIGCMAQAYQNEILRRFPHVDFVCGPANIYDIPDLLDRVKKDGGQILAVNRKQRPLICDEAFRKDASRAFVSIMYGCDNFCSYCLVPYVRGREKSRPLKHILDEVKGLALRGCKEVTLLGQNVNSYGKDLRGKTGFAGLLEKLNAIKGIERIRFVTSHPKDASLSLFRAMRDLPKVCEHLHLPLQAGSDKILAKMNRKYTLKDYSKLVDNLRRLIPDCSLTTDIIVGFPGESEKDFLRTYQAMEKIRFDEAFIFKYSPRPKTAAAKLRDDVSLSIKQKRNQALLKLQDEISLSKNRELVDTVNEVLVEGKGRCFGSNEDMLRGRNRGNKITLFSAKKDLIFQAVNVKIGRATTHTLIGEIYDEKN